METEKRSDATLAADDTAKSKARDLLASPHAALAYSDLDGAPGISRIALGLDPEGIPLALISALSVHFAALRAHRACAFMVGEPGPKGDPLTHPRLMVRAEAEFVARHDPSYTHLRDNWLISHPKARLYIDFADFAFVRLRPRSALLNGGFGRAFRLSPEDLLA